MENIGARIKAARTAAEMTQHALGIAVGVSRDTIRRWESNKTEPSLREVGLIADATGHDFKTGNGISLDVGKKMVIPVISMRMPACAGAGNGVFLDEAEEEMEVDVSLFKQIDDMRRPFGVHVEGDSMEEMGVCDGDVAIINPSERPNDGEIALVCYRDRLSIKGIRRNKDGSVSLLAGKPEYNIVVPADEADDDHWFKILGTIVTSRSERKPKRFW